MTTISGTTGIDRVQDGSIGQADLAANVAGNGIVVRTIRSSQSITSGGSSQVVTFTTEFTDTDNSWNGSRFQPQVAGYYIVSTSIKFAAIAATGERSCSIRRNGTEIMASNFSLGISGMASVIPVNNLVFLNGSTDYLEVTAYQTSGSPLALDGSHISNFFSACLVRAA